MQNVLLVNFSNVASLRKKHRNIYNTDTRPTKLRQPKKQEWDNLSKVENSKLKKDTITCQSGS